MKTLKISKKIGIAGLIALVALVPLTVLGTTEGDESAAQETASGPWGFRWLGRGFGRGGGFMEAVCEKLGITDEEFKEATQEVMIEELAERLDLTQEEIDEVTPIVQDISDLREQLKAKREELDAVIGDKLDAYRESMMEQGDLGFRRMRGRGRRRFPCRGPLEEETSEE